jgi:hypothetical protein
MVPVDFLVLGFAVALTAVRADFRLFGLAFALGLRLSVERAVLGAAALGLDRIGAVFRFFVERTLLALDFTAFFMPSDAPVCHNGLQSHHAILSTIAL